MQRDERVTMRFTKNERDLVKGAADTKGEKESAFGRRVILTAARKVIRGDANAEAES